MKRIVHPPRTLENVGFFLPDGEVELDNEDYGLESAMVEDSDSGGQEEAEEDVSVRVKEEAQEKKERKPTYYELLQERMRQREAQAAEEQICEKKPRID
ncbi:hypothetical protein ANCDUO_22672 [Ancylostoma duodenale]|uniref:Uncharacterized protein n=1 Tax=Ancylostoma duodenale TaxID=51022 RepID=A0A0C2BTM4_9BILA|nr:hypothetical protein ANCDUO_22672 [Ancylostoma duodenale]